jgi:alkylation response protein AidB-like acyl-CoA dehydrogenase
VLGSASTEPNSGSDHRLPPDDDLKAGFRLRAERKGDEWILNGEKCFIANGSVGKLFFVSARTDPNVRMREGTTLLMVPSDTPGFRVGKVFNKSGWRFYQNAELIFENARVPHANVVGEVNGGFKTRGGSFGDLELAANALGVCEAAVEMAMQHVKTRTTDGKPVIEHQVIQLKLSEMHMLTEALRSFVMRVAWEMDNAVRGSVNAVLVMNFSTDVIQRVTHLNMEIHNAAGFTMDAGADKLVRDGIIWTHLAGDSVLRMKVVRRLIK